jgi:hypothetical protein
MQESFTSYAVQARRKRVPDLIEYTFIRALMCDITLKVAQLSPTAEDKMREERYRRIATLMNLDWYSATHPFDKEVVEIEPTRYTGEEIDHWWIRYHNLTAADVVDLIWVEVDL